MVEEPMKRKRFLNLRRAIVEAEAWRGQWPPEANEYRQRWDAFIARAQKELDAVIAMQDELIALKSDGR